MIDFDQEKVTSVVSGFQIPVRPELLNTIQELMKAPEPDIDKIAQTISTDIGLSASILKAINSPFYGCNRKIIDIKQAVMTLGLKIIESLVVALMLKSSFSGKSSICLDRFWQDATDVANAMTYIGKALCIQVPAETLYTVGLFHNCGIPLLSLKYEDYERVLIEATQKNENSLALEDIHYQTNHAILGYFIASSWHLPKDICKLIAQHHAFDYLTRENTRSNKELFSVLKIAENLLDKIKRFKVSPDWQFIQNDVLSQLRLTELDYTALENDYFDLHQ